MRDDAATRFAAGRFRRVFRSLRPLLDTENDPSLNSTDTDDEREDFYELPKLVLSKQYLDDRVRLFALMLIEEWIANPFNVRLLRIASDLYPNYKILDKTLMVLKDGWKGGCKIPE
ncbi:MAG TPA: hypothetical protein DDW50_03575 [Firmicutes bacterium]|nr:hypothetical protein [Bacillota bacterium]